MFNIISSILGYFYIITSLIQAKKSKDYLILFVPVFYLSVDFSVKIWYTIQGVH